MKDNEKYGYVSPTIIDEDDEIVTLANGDEEIDFILIATLSYEGKDYAALQPVIMPEGMANDEALLFRKFKGENGEDNYVFETDEEIVSAVFAEYERLLSEEN